MSKSVFHLMVFDLQRFIPAITKYDISHHLFEVILFTEVTAQEGRDSTGVHGLHRLSRLRLVLFV